MKRVPTAFLAIALAGLLAIGCRSNNPASTATDKARAATFDVAAMKKEIEDKNSHFTRAHVTGDSAVMVNIFTQDARVFPPNSDAVIGRPAIEVLTSQYLKFGIKEFREETTAFYGNDEYLIDEGNYVMIYGKDSTIEKGKYLNVWRREDGDWKIYSNIWNANTPEPPAK